MGRTGAGGYPIYARASGVPKKCPLPDERGGNSADSLFSSDASNLSFPPFLARVDERGDRIFRSSSSARLRRRRCNRRAIPETTTRVIPPIVAPMMTPVVDLDMREEYCAAGVKLEMYSDEMIELTLFESDTKTELMRYQQ